MHDALATHYARALADAVFAPNSGLAPHDAVAQLDSAASLIAESKDLNRVLLTPALTRGKKTAIVANLADALEVHRLIRNFLLVVAMHRRVNDLPNIRRSFEEVVDERLGWIPAEIVSAAELSAEQREEVERALGTKMGKFIRAHYTVDASLLGGVVARVGTREFDATLRGRLENMRRALASPVQ